MGAKARHGCLVVAAACCCAVLASCEPSTDKSADEPAARIPAHAPRVVLTGDDREVWAPAPPDRAVVPVLLYHRVAAVSGFSKRADADLGIDPEDCADENREHRPPSSRVPHPHECESSCCSHG